jgi:hypothetical protein
MDKTGADRCICWNTKKLLRRHGINQKMNIIQASRNDDKKKNVCSLG